MADVLLINGPNLNLLGRREPSIYGHKTLAEIESELSQLADQAQLKLACFQSNAEHEIVERIQEAGSQNVRAILINPGAFTHTSVAIRDALLGVAIPFYEIHLSNIFAREEFRHRSYLSDIAAGSVIGMGPLGYEFALRAAVSRLDNADDTNPS